MLKIKNLKKDDFHEKYDKVAIRRHQFSISQAIMRMLENNLELHSITKGNFELAVNFATTAWNMAIINDLEIIDVFIDDTVKVLKPQVKGSRKQVETILRALVKLKQQLFPNVYRMIMDYSAEPDQNGKPYLRIVSGQDESPEHFAQAFRTKLAGKAPNKAKYGWVKKDEGE